MSEPPSPKKGFMSRLFHSKSNNRLRKAALSPPRLPSNASLYTTSSQSTQTTQITTSPTSSAPSKPKPLAHGAVYRPSDDNRDEQTGERRDDTDLLHGLAHHESHESLDSMVRIQEWRPPGEREVASLSVSLWGKITSFLSPGDKAALAFSTRTLMRLIGTECWWELEKEENFKEKLNFLVTLDKDLPGHLLCFSCARYHRRIQPGRETLKRKTVLNPVYQCPMVGKPGHVQPRARLTPQWNLPFTFVQLATRGQRYGIATYGIHVNELGRRWRDSSGGWSHESRFYIHKGHLLMRITSRSFAAPKLPPSGLRHLLYSREDYTPYFSACAHWQDGELMPVCKCALSHVPEHRQTKREQLRQGPMIRTHLSNPNPIVLLCSKCRPMRRCPECPSEYLVELKLAEDKEDPVVTFKQVIVVTRWCDFGDGKTPFGPEWCALNGLEVEDQEAYDSFAQMGKRAISGVFEAQSGITMPGQRLISLNPKKIKLGEEGDDWY